MRLYLKLHRTGAEALILLDEIHAPRVCGTLLTLLPSEGPLLHSRRSGQEVFAVLLPVALAEENLVTSVGPGDVLAASFPAYYRDAPPASIWDPVRGYTHVGIVYGPDSRFATPEGYPRVRLIGRIVEGLDELVHACTIIRKTGQERYTLRRQVEGEQQ